MKLIPSAGLYISPLPNQGTFEGVTIEEREMIIRRKENFLSVKFVMFYLKDGKEVVLGTKTMEFIGLESDPREITTNQTTLFKYPNPAFVSYEETPEEIPVFENVPFLRYLNENAGVLPEGYEITEYGYPTYEAALQYFEGGTLQSPEIHISEPLAIGFLLNKLSINGEVVGKQFKIETL